MRMTLYLQFGQGAELPLNYRHLLQGQLYHLLGKQERFASIHDEDSRVKNFRPFTFSPLIGKFEIKPGKRIRFTGRVSWTLSTYDPMISHYLYTALYKAGTIRLGSLSMPVQEIFIHPEYEPTGIIEMLAPCTVWRTEQTGETKRARYVNPLTAEFAELVESNARSKYEQQFGKPFTGSFRFQPIAVGARDKTVAYYKTTLIEGWSGTYLLEADEDMAHLLHGIGIGGKNAQGFGLFRWKDLETRR